MRSGQTLFEKIWQAHVIADLGDDAWLIHVDRHLLHELSGAVSFRGLEKKGAVPRNSALTFATVDHLIDTTPGRTDRTLIPRGREYIETLRTACREHGVQLFDLHDPAQGIVHVIGPQLGLALPGTTIVCGDSHTCTLGGMGAYAFGIGSTDGEVVLAAQSIVQTKPRTMRIRLDGTLAPQVTAKDLVLHLIGALGADGGNGHVVELSGPVARSLSIEERLTICNMGVELSARAAIIAPDDATLDYLHGKPYAPRGRAWDEAVRHWRALRSDPGAIFDREVVLDCSGLGPSVTWGTSPEHVVPVSGCVPDPASAPDATTRAQWERALAYMGLAPNEPLAGLHIDAAFIGSCTNARLSDLQAAAAVLRGQRIAPAVRAICVPGSMAVKREAESLGLDQVFRTAGFEWREPGCSLCMSGGAGGETFAPGQRVISSTNRNFEHRQGKGVRSHLASPATVALSAIRGCISDVSRVASRS